MELHRQELPPPDPRREPPQRVPETKPPVLGDWFIYLSVVVLICGVVAITAFEFGSPLTSALVRFPALIAAGLLIVLSADGAVRAWRSAWAWLPVDRPRGVQRFVWAVVLAGVLVGSAALIWFLVTR